MNEEITVEVNKKDPDSLIGKKIKAVPAPEKNIGIDTRGEFIDDLIAAGQSNQIDMTEINKFCRLSQSRDQMYAMIDTMAQDSTISAVLETYAEDATETNFDGKIVWASSDDSKVNQFVNYLLDSINVDKHIYKWMYSLCKYGDCYLRLYRKSEFCDNLFDDAKAKNKENRLINEAREAEVSEPKESLTEDVRVKIYSKNDKYVHYLEMVPNPAEMYELTRFGKSYAYIQAPMALTNIRAQSQWTQNSYYQYRFKKNDIDLYDATNFVHALLDDNSSRVPERVKIFSGTGDLNSVDGSGDYSSGGSDSSDEGALTYDVRRGQSLLADSFKIWREMGLLENALLLNRITKSSFIRVLNIEVGDMPKEQIGPHLQGIKQLVEQKAAINTNESMSEYVNPGPMENTIYVPTHGGQGTISPVQIGGEVDVKGLADIDYFRDKLFGSLKVPKQNFGFTEDGAGFNAGTSLSILSSRYAKTVKRLQNSMIQALTDAINLMLLDKGLPSYVNKFTLHMQAPTTQEELDRITHLGDRIRMVQDIMNLVGDMPSDSSKLKVLKVMIGSVTTDPEIVRIIQEQIDILEAEEAKAAAESQAEESGIDLGGESGGDIDIDINTDGGGKSEVPMDIGEPPDLGDIKGSVEISEPAGGAETSLPSPADLGMDFTDNSAF